MYQIYHFPVGYLKVNCYLIKDENSGEAFLVDPGDEAGFLIEEIEKLSAKVKAVFVTHAHFDHIGATFELAEHFHCPLYATREEVEEAETHPIFSRMMKRHYENFHTAFSRFGKAVKEGNVFPLGDSTFTVINVPGHSVSGSCFYCAKEHLLFSGDTLFAGTVGREDLYLEIHGEPGVLRENIARKLLVLPPETKVFPGHGKQTTVGEEKNENEWPAL